MFRTATRAAAIVLSFLILAAFVALRTGADTLAALERTSPIDLADVLAALCEPVTDSTERG